MRGLKGVGFVSVGPLPVVGGALEKQLVELAFFLATPSVAGIRPLGDFVTKIGG